MALCSRPLRREALEVYFEQFHKGSSHSIFLGDGTCRLLQRKVISLRGLEAPAGPDREDTSRDSMPVEGLFIFSTTPMCAPEIRASFAVPYALYSKHPSPPCSCKRIKDTFVHGALQEECALARNR